MAFHVVSLSLLGMIGVSVPSCRAASPGWARLSLTGPNKLIQFGSGRYYVDNMLFGTPPASESLFLDIASPMLAVSSTDCVFCPGTDLFDRSLSSTYKTTNNSWPTNNVELGGVVAQDTISFGGILTSPDAPFRIIDRMLSFLRARILNGHFGLWVDPTNETGREQHILTRLYASGQLLNPVVGLRMGRTPDTSRITIGALDPADFDGAINWIQAETPDPSWETPSVIKLDGLRGFNGSFLPYPNPLLAYLDSWNANINVPNAWNYMNENGYTGPQDIQPNKLTSNLYAYLCNMTGGAYVHLSVDINGVSYQIDSQDNLLKRHDVTVLTEVETTGYCDVGIANLTTTSTVPSSLGLPFLRSVYLAYRFPTADCPNAYYGFAFQKGANRTSSMIGQKPRSTPSASAQCLSLAAPTSTPAVSTRPPQVAADSILSEGSYSVWGHPEEKQVRLKGVGELKAGVVRD